MTDPSAPLPPGASTKDGVPHILAPVNVLEQILTLRIHLDVADADNGCLHVLPGSHRSGISGPPKIEAAPCPVAAGAVLAMRPLLWHSSQKSTDRRPRRVLHVEFTDQELPGGMDWHERW